MKVIDEAIDAKEHLSMRSKFAKVRVSNQAPLPSRATCDRPHKMSHSFITKQLRSNMYIIGLSRPHLRSYQSRLPSFASIALLSYLIQRSFCIPLRYHQASRIRSELYVCT